MPCGAETRGVADKGPLHSYTTPIARLESPRLRRRVQSVRHRRQARHTTVLPEAVRQTAHKYGGHLATQCSTFTTNPCSICYIWHVTMHITDMRHIDAHHNQTWHPQSEQEALLVDVVLRCMSARVSRVWCCESPLQPKGLPLMADRTYRSTPPQHAATTPTTANGTHGADGTYAPTRRKPGPKPGTEAAKRGGTAVRERYGPEFYRRIGAKGGATVRDQHGPSFYRAIGRLGGETTKQRLGADHYVRIGRIGGHSAHGTHGAEGAGTTRNADNVTR